jgi:hypothetical protein
MEPAEHIARVTCPACGGAGGGPFGRAGSAWDDEDFICPRCKGAGAIALDDVMVQSQRPGLVKAIPDAAAADEDATTKKPRKASA